MYRLQNKWTVNVLLSFLFVGSIVLILSACQNKSQVAPPKEDILAKVGNRTISVNEFIRRAEYTLRPAYCARDNYIHKKIVLNSLIAEKLLAIEAGDDNPLAHNEDFKAFIRGRKEQAMRQWLYYVEGEHGINIDTTEIKQVYQNAGREYTIQFFTTPDTLKTQLREILQNHPEQFSAFYQEITHQDTIPQKDITWENASSRPLFEMLYQNPVAKNEIIGPVSNGDGTATVVKVAGWVDHKAIADADVQDRIRKIKDRLSEFKATDRYEQFVEHVMAGKHLEFNRNTFFKLADILAPLYLMDKKQKQALANKTMWGEQTPDSLMDQVRADIDNIVDWPLFRMNDDTWTIGDYRDAIESHPLVFRASTLNRDNFPEQLKLAIVDLVRDQYLNQVAYERHYDENPLVKRNVAMFRDQMYALYQRNKYLKEVGFTGNFNSDYLDAIQNYLNPYIDSLQTKYSPEIQINTDRFEKIQLTHIDMLATLKNVPYPIAVPSFPVVTTDNRLDYGRKME